MPRSLFACLLVVVAAGSALTFDAIAAGEQSVAALARSKVPTLGGNKAPPSSAALQPQYLFLIRSTLSALHDANSTGNYSVLRDLAAPSFQAKHSAADLAEIFAAARRRPIDLGPAAYVMPILTETSRPEATQLHLVGYVSHGGERVTFVLHFEAVGGHWRISALSIGTAKG